MTNQIQLTVEEALTYQQFDVHLQGYLEGVSEAVNHMRRRKIQEIIAARPKQEGGAS